MNKKMIAALLMCLCLLTTAFSAIAEEEFFFEDLYIDLDAYGDGIMRVVEDDWEGGTLESEYNMARAQAEAKGEGELAAARYEEWVRQEEAAAQQAQFDAQQARKNSDAAWDTAMTLLKAGAMPDAATLSAAGISAADAKSYLAAVRESKAAKSSSGSTSSKKKAETKEEKKTGNDGAIASYDGLSPAAKSMYTSFQTQMRRSGYPYVTDQMRTNLFNAYMNGTITRKEYTFILQSLGG